MRILLTIFLLLLPLLLLASGTDPDYALSNAHRLSVAVNSAFINGFDDSGISLYIDVLAISCSIFFLIRSFIEYNNGDITVNDLVFSRFLFILFVFTILDPVLYFSLMDILKNTAFELGDILQKIFTGFYDFYSILGRTIYIMMNVTPVTASLSFGEIALITFILMIAAFFLFKQLLQALISILFFYIFSYVSYNILAVIGFFILPLVFIKELSFVVTGFGKALMFLFIFTILWKLIVSISLFLLFTALYGLHFVNQISQGSSVHNFLAVQTSIINSGQSISLAINGPLDVIVPIAFMTMAIFLISLTFQLTQLVMTGFFSFRANFI